MNKNTFVYKWNFIVYFKIRETLKAQEVTFNNITIDVRQTDMTQVEAAIYCNSTNSRLDLNTGNLNYET